MEKIIKKSNIPRKGSKPWIQDFEFNTQPLSHIGSNGRPTNSIFDSFLIGMFAQKTFFQTITFFNFCNC